MKNFLKNMPGGLWMILAGLAFAYVNNALQYLSMNLSVPSATQVLFQYGFAVLFLLPFLNRGAIQAIVASEYRLLHLLRIVVSVIGIQLWTWALSYVPIWQGIALLMTSPLFATLGSGLFLGEKVSTMRWGATCFGFVGAMLILAPWSDSFTLYALLPVGAAMFWASASLMTKYSLNSDSPVTVVAYMLILMLPVNLVFAVPSLSLPTSLLAWALIILAGVLTLFAQWAIVKAYASADASYVQPFDHVKLLFNVLIGYWVFGYAPPGEWWYVGVFMIILAVTVITFYEREPIAKAREATNN